MSIFEHIFSFIGGLFKSIEKQYKKLSPEIKAQIELAIKYVNIVKENVDKPANEIVTIAGAVLGADKVSKISGVLGKVIVDLGIAESALDNPEEALEAVVEHIKPLQGNKWKDTVFDFTKYIITHLSGGSINRNLAQILLQWVYDKFFNKNEVKQHEEELVAVPA